MYKHNFNFLIFLFALAQCRHNSSCDRTARASLTETVTPPGNKVVLPAQNTSQIMANVSQMTLVCSSSTLPQQDHSTSTINRVTAHSSQLSSFSLRANCGQRRVLNFHWTRNTNIILFPARLPHVLTLRHYSVTIIFTIYYTFHEFRSQPLPK